MSIKDHALLVSVTVNKPQLTAKDNKATSDAEVANGAYHAGQYRKNLYPAALIRPILTTEASARAFCAAQTWAWGRGEFLLPAARAMEFMDRMSKYELQFGQAVTAFLNNWSNVLAEAQATQGGLFRMSDYPDVSALRQQFRFRTSYRAITDGTDFRVQLQQHEMDAIAARAEQDTRESMTAALRSPIERLRTAIERLHEATGKGDREVLNKATGVVETRPPIFRDSIVENVVDELALIADFADILPNGILSVAEASRDVLVHPQQLRDDPARRADTHAATRDLLGALDAMLDD